MRTTVKKLSLFSLAALAAVTWTVAGESVDRTLDADAHGTVEIEIGAGTVKIVGWKSNKVQIRGTVPEGEDMFEIDQDGDTISIEVALPESDWDWDDDDDDGDRRGRRGGRRIIGHGDRDDTELEIRVPHGTSLEIEGIAVDVTIENVSGEIALEVISGDVDLSGDLTELEIEVVSGDIDIEGNGDLSDLDIEAVSGTVEVRSGLDRRASVSIQSVSGDIILYLASNASCDVEAQTFNGDIDSDFGDSPRRHGQFVPSKSLEFTLGSGDADVSLQTFNGNIEIREN